MAEMKETIREAIEQIKQVADTRTVIGEPMQLINGVTIVPVSRIAVGTAVGGGDYDAKKKTNKKSGTTVVNGGFAGGSGAGISVSPVAFLVITAEGEIKMLNIGENTGYLENSITGIVNGFDSILDKAPVLRDKVVDLFRRTGIDKKAGAAKDTEDDVTEEDDE